MQKKLHQRQRMTSPAPKFYPPGEVAHSVTTPPNNAMPTAYSLTDDIVKRTKEIQRDACDQIEALFLVSMKDLGGQRRLYQPDRFVPLTPDQPTYRDGVFPEAEDLRTALPARYFDDDDTSGGDGARSAPPLSRSSQSVHTARTPSTATAVERSPLKTARSRSHSKPRMTRPKRGRSGSKTSKKVPDTESFKPSVSDRSQRSPDLLTALPRSAMLSPVGAFRTARSKSSSLPPTAKEPSPGPYHQQQPALSPEPPTALERSSSVRTALEPLKGFTPAPLFGRSVPEEAHKDPSYLRTGREQSPLSGAEPRASRSRLVKQTPSSLTLTSPSKGVSTAKVPSSPVAPSAQRLHDGREPEEDDDPSCICHLTDRSQPSEPNVAYKTSELAMGEKPSVSALPPPKQRCKPGNHLPNCPRRYRKQKPLAKPSDYSLNRRPSESAIPAPKPSELAMGEKPSDYAVDHRAPTTAQERSATPRTARQQPSALQTGVQRSDYALSPKQSLLAMGEKPSRSALGNELNTAKHVSPRSASSTRTMQAPSESALGPKSSRLAIGEKPSSTAPDMETGLSPSMRTDSARGAGSMPRVAMPSSKARTPAKGPPSSAQEPSTRTGIPRSPYETSARTAHEPSTRTGRGLSPYPPSTRTGHEPKTPTARGQSPYEPSTRTGRGLSPYMPSTRTSQEPSTCTGQEPSTRTGRGISPYVPSTRTGQEPSTRTGQEPSTRTGRGISPYVPSTRTGQEPSTRTGLAPSTRTGQEPKTPTARGQSPYEPSTRTGRPLSPYTPSTRTGQEPSTRTGRGLSPYAPSTRTAQEPSTRTGRGLSPYAPSTRTGQEPSTRTGLAPSTRTGQEPETPTARGQSPYEPSTRTGRGLSPYAPSTRTGQEPSTRTGRGLSPYAPSTRTGQEPKTPTARGRSPYEPSNRTGRPLSPYTPSTRTGQEPSTRTGRGLSPYAPSTKTGQEPSTRTGRGLSPYVPSTRTGQEPSTRTGRGLSPYAPSTKTGQEPSTRTGRGLSPLSPSTRTGQKPSTRTGRGLSPYPPSTRTGEEPSTRTGRGLSPYPPSTRTGEEPSTRTGLEPSPRTGREPNAMESGPKLCDDCLRTARLKQASPSNSQVQTALGEQSPVLPTAKEPEELNLNTARNPQSPNVPTALELEEPDLKTAQLKEEPVPRSRALPQMATYEEVCPMCCRPYLVQRPVPSKRKPVHRSRLLEPISPQPEQQDLETAVLYSPQSGSSLPPSDTSLSVTGSTSSGSGSIYSTSSGSRPRTLHRPSQLSNLSANSSQLQYLEEDDQSVPVNVLVIERDAGGISYRREHRVLDGALGIRRSVKILMREFAPGRRLATHRVYLEHEDALQGGRVSRIDLSSQSDQPIASLAQSADGVSLVLDIAGSWDGQGI